MYKKISSMISIVLIGIILITSVLIPLIQTSIDAERTLINNSVYSSNYSIIEDPVPNDLSVLIEYTMGNDEAITNGESVPVGAYNSYLVMSSHCYVQIGLSGTNPNRYAGVGDTSLHNIPSTVQNIRIEILGDSISIAMDGDAPINLNYEGVDWVAYADADGTHKLKSKDSGSGNQNVTVNSLDQIYGATVITINDVGFASFNGSSMIAQDSVTYTMVVDEIETPYVDAIRFKNGNGYHIDTNQLINANDNPVVPYYYLVPNNVVVHTESQFAMSSILPLIPILLTIALCVIIVRGTQRS